MAENENGGAGGGKKVERKEKEGEDLGKGMAGVRDAPSFFLWDNWLFDPNKQSLSTKRSGRRRRKRVQRVWGSSFCVKMVRQRPLCSNTYGWEGGIVMEVWQALLTKYLQELRSPRKQTQNIKTHFWSDTTMVKACLDLERWWFGLK